MIEYLAKLLACTELDNVWKLHCQKMAEYGFDRMIYGYSQFGSENSVGPQEDALVLSNHEAEYLAWYMGEEQYRHAPLTNWAMNNTGPISWRVIGERYEAMSLEQQSVVQRNKSFGVTAGYSISFLRASTRSRGIIALTARAGLHQNQVDAIWDKHGQEIEVLCNVAHLKIIALPHIGHCPSLSPRQLEVLEWVGDGKTNQDIATIMGLSPATIEKHLRLAREKMNVETTAQAVMKASFQNQMYVVQI